MYHQPSKKAILRKKIATMLVSILVVVVGVVILSAYMLGYNFNRKDGRVERMGILQLDSTPSNAAVYINDQPHSSNTRARLVLSPGTFDVRLEKDKYHAWHKNVTIKAGELTWTNYPRLIPKQLPVNVVEALPATLADALPSGSSKRYAFLEKIDTPVIRIASIDRDTPVFKTLTVPEEIYSRMGEIQGDHAFKLHLWSGNERFIILQHTYNTQKTTEWLLVDTEKPEESLNISKLFGIDDLTELVFSDYSGSQLYALTHGAVRSFDIANRTISSPIVEHVEEFRLYGDGYVLFSSHKSDSQVRTVGYTKKGFKQPYTVKIVPFKPGHKVLFDVAKYYDRYYFLIADGVEAQLYSSRALPHDIATKLELQEVATLHTEQVIIAANITENGQLATVQDGTMFTTYNLEAAAQHSAKIQNNNAGTPQKLRYLDTYLLWAEHDGKLRTYEFDGGNQHDIMPIEARFDATLSPSGKYLYGVRKAEAGSYELVRVKLLDI